MPSNSDENELIYSFMNGKWRPVKEGYNSGTRTVIDKKFQSRISCQKFCDKENKLTSEKLWVPLPYSNSMDSGLHYDEKWDWLMPVVEKIEWFGFAFHLQQNQALILGKGIEDDNFPWLEDFPEDGFYTEDMIEDSKIIATWKVCIQFIKWYNVTINRALNK